MKLKVWIIVWVVLLFCSNATATIVGQVFPTIEAETLNNQLVTLPLDIKGNTQLIFIGYSRKSQADAQKWSEGLKEVGINAPYFFIPAISSRMAATFKGRISKGMRKGYSEAEWNRVMIAWGSNAKQLIAFTGQKKPKLTRVILVDSKGVVQYFYDKGFQTDAVNQLKQKIATIQ